VFAVTDELTNTSSADSLSFTANQLPPTSFLPPYLSSAPPRHPPSQTLTASAIRMPPLLGYKYPAARSGPPRTSALTSPTMAMAGPIPTSTGTKPYAESEYISTSSPVILDSNPLPPAVTITLTSRRRTQDAIRHIVLHPDEPIIIGRSSRSEFKNLSSSNDNALFDCPVVSRTHAKFELTFNKWDAKDMYKVYIVDTGSMHGTSVNGQKLQPNRRFLLSVGDIIRLGDSVAHGPSEHPLAETSLVTSHADRVPDSYDGVIITLECISVATQKDSTQAKTSQRGISCPSEPESDSDDDSVLEVEAPSSAQTTPDQPAEKPAMKKLAKFGSSVLTGIVLDDDENDLESVAAAPTITARSIMVPDTYDEDSYDAPDDALDAERRSEFYNAVTDYIRTATDEQQEMDEEDDAVYGAEDSELHFSDDDQSQVSSNDDNTSDAASSHHSFDSEPNSMSDFQDDEDEHEWAEQNDLCSIHDDQDEDEDEEGPETMSSKRTQSVEIGTLGDAHDDHEYQPSDVPPREPAVPTRSHYDPVRGMFQVAPAPFTDHARTTRSYDLFPPPSYSGVYANAWDSSKWDVGPNDTIMNQVYPQPAEDYSSLAYITGDPAYGEQTYPSQSAWSSLRHQPGFAEIVQGDVPAAPTLCDSSKKRKASEISTGFVPTTTAPEYQSPSANEPFIQELASKFEESAQEESNLDNPVISAAPEEPLTVERPSKKLKTILQPRTKKSMLRAAAVEASKYTAGAIIGSIGLVTLLASPIGEALASC
jgi:pSer/pThr/pTyr-binding forkhead associated (FHA) protein